MTRCSLSHQCAVSIGWLAFVTLLALGAAACGGPPQRSAVPVSCRAAALASGSQKMPGLGKFTAELSFNGSGNGFTLAPPPTNARPIVSASKAWKAVLPLPPGGTYRFVLADRADYNPYPGTVLVWVLMETHVPRIIMAPVPQVPGSVRQPTNDAVSGCTYFSGVVTVNSTTGAIDLATAFGVTPNNPNFPRVLACSHQSPASGGPSCQWHVATWPWGAE